jgi:hypothetical protein
MPEKKPSRSRDPYERAYNAAVKRRDKAIAERDKCEARYRALVEEIPRLEQIIAVLSAKPSGTPTALAPPQASHTGPLPCPGLPMGIPAHLEKFLRPVIRPTEPEKPKEDDDDDLPPIPGEPVLE